ncbi:L,D-transpeptidase family protein [Streptomyces canus]|uniref:L,D-transpeptidase family protein n=1 Tax=Streptomyces canus TaxID=58343 RepID=UPI0006840019|nr:L,D-transpeptidase family protein [Streptomyces canus]
MRGAGARRAVVTTTVLGALLIPLGGCGGPGPAHPGGLHTGAEGRSADKPADRPTRIPDVGDRLQRRIPAASRQVLAVYGDGKDSPDATVVLYTQHGSGWERVRDWPAHNGKKGWTTDHREGDRRSPVGVFTLSDAGGVLPDPGARLPYTRSAAMAAPRWWPRSYWHDFDYVIAIDYNRIEGTSPNNQTRPRGYSEGGGIWLHMDHGSGTSACVSVSRPAMRYLLRTLDPDRHPVVVMGDRADLKA